MSDFAPQPTQAPPETGKVTMDFIGVPTRMDGGRIKTFATGTPRWQFTCSIPMNEQNKDLIWQLMTAAEKEVFVGFGFMQGALAFPEAPTVADYPQPAPDAVILDALNTKGDKIFPHHFVPGDGGVCGACELVSDHAIHSDASIAARQASQARTGQPPQTQEIVNTSADDASTGNAAADALIADLSQPDHVEPKDEAEAEAQADAKAALSARTRR